MQVNEAKFMILMLMMVIGLVPMIFMKLSSSPTTLKYTLSFSWLVFWWLLPFVNMVRFVLNN